MFLFTHRTPECLSEIICTNYFTRHCKNWKCFLKEKSYPHHNVKTLHTRCVQQLFFITLTETRLLGMMSLYSHCPRHHRLQSIFDNNNDHTNSINQITHFFLWSFSVSYYYYLRKRVIIVI